MIEWSVSPEIFSIGGFAPRWYGMFFAFAFYLAHRFTRWQFVREGYDGLQADRLLLYMMVGTILGARLGHCLLYEPEIYLFDPLRILKVWEGGLASHGALAGILTGLILFRRGYPKVSLIGLLDRLCVWVAMSGVLIRLGNLMNSEIVGKPTDVPWAFKFMHLDGIPRHPAQLYEALTYLVIFIVLLRMYLEPALLKRPGFIFGWHMILIFGSRFFIEFVKERQVDFEANLPLDMGQLLSIPFVAVGIFLVWRSRRGWVAALVAVLLLSTSAHARWATEDDTDSAVEFQNIHYEVRRDGGYTMDVEEEVAILKDSARRERGIVQLRYNSRSSELKVLSAETLSGKRRIPVDPSMIEDKPLASSASGFDQMNQVMVVFPEITVGARTLIRYRRDVKEVPHAGQFSESFTYGWYELEKAGKVTIRSELPLFVVRLDPENRVSVKQTKDGEKFTIELILKKPAFRKVVDEKHAFMDPDSVPRVYVSTTKHWPDLGNSVADEYEKIVAAPLPQFFKDIVAASKSEKTWVAKIDAATSRLSEKMHYLGDWRPIRGGHIPRSLEKIAQTRYGDCKDFSVAVASMLRALGVEAQVAWIYRDSHPFIASMELPRDSLFNHAIVRARVDGQDYWIDGTNPQSWAAGIPNDIADRPALVIQSLKSVLVQTPPVAFSDGFTGARFKTSLGKADEVKTEGRLELKGRAAVPFTGLSLSTSGDTIKFNIAKFASGGDPLKSWDVKTVDLSSRIVRDLEFQFSLVARNFELRTSAGPAYPLDPPAAVSALLQDIDRRVSMLWIGDPYRSRKEITLPGTAKVGTKSLDCTIDAPWARVSRTFESPPEGVRIIEEVDLKQGLIPLTVLKSKRFAAYQDELRLCFGQVALVYQFN